MSSCSGAASEVRNPKRGEVLCGPIPSRVGEPQLEPGTVRFMDQLRGFASRGLTSMYRPDQRSFVFRVRRQGNKIVQEGLSRRYTAIALIGLAGESAADRDAILAGSEPGKVIAKLCSDIGTVNNLGDAALTLWAATANVFDHCEAIRQRVLELAPITSAHPTVELAWALAAFCVNGEAEFVSDRIAKRLIAAFNQRSALFPHVAGESGSWLRRHVCCFADQVYPIHALSLYYSITGDKSALHAAELCAARICYEQGEAGQWWWHYDYRDGKVIEGYPVYAVHQDAMAPMALFALSAAGGSDFTDAVARGVSWLADSPELGGGSLIDRSTDFIWRKVARREPRKLTRYVQAIATRSSPSLSVRGMGALFPPCAIDFEDRPYHLGWLLYAWPKGRVEQSKSVDHGTTARVSRG